jgi:hypothetical protein
MLLARWLQERGRPGCGDCHRAVVWYNGGWRMERELLCEL